MKKRFTKELVLVAPNLGKKIRIKVKILDYIIKEVLSMKCEDGWWRPVAYLSKSLNKIEKNYEIHNKEMLAIIRELKNWRHLLEDVKFKSKVQTDYKKLEYFMKAQKLNHRQAR